MSAIAGAATRAGKQRAQRRIADKANLSRAADASHRFEENAHLLLGAQGGRSPTRSPSRRLRDVPGADDERAPRPVSGSCQRADAGCAARMHAVPQPRFWLIAGAI